MSSSSGTEPSVLSVKILESKVVRPCVDVISFAVRLPLNILDITTTGSYDDTSTQRRIGTNGVISSHFHETKGIVGTITFLGPRSVMIWIGFGELRREPNGFGDPQNPNHDSEVNTSLNPSFRAVGASITSPMGPLFVSMPHTPNVGAFSDPKAGSTSKLIGDGSGRTHMEMIARQMSSRLSQRLHIAVFVSCSLDVSQFHVNRIDEEEVIASQAAALAESEVHRIIKEKLNIR